jgi:hypothetical protein
MKNADQEIVIVGVEIARRILGEYIEPGKRDAEVTIQRLLAVLDDNDFITALERLRKRQIIRLVE